MYSTPYSSVQGPPNPWPQPDVPNSAQSWTFGQSPPTGTSSWPPPQQQPVWGPTTPASPWGQGQATPASPWGQGTPAGTWGALSPTGSHAPATPSGYPAFAGYGPQPQSPYSSSGQPIPFGADNGQHQKKKKKRRSIREPSWDGNMSRSNSMISNPPLQRSASWGPVYAREAYNILNLARRPRDWRPDYTPRDGIAALASYLPTIGRSKSDVREFSDPIRRQIHPLLLWDPQSPPIYFDLRDDPNEIHFLHLNRPHNHIDLDQLSPPIYFDLRDDPNEIHFLHLNRPHNHIDLDQLVTQPSSSSLRLSHPRLPWYIDVVQVFPNGITVRDIFEQIHQQLHAPIQDHHFFTEELNEMDRSRLTHAFQRRVGDDLSLHEAGILRIDFLGDKCVFEGLVRGTRGMWEMKTTRG
ncbi:hypothetical protein M413DRAFT_15656 [Hebeloma cylindrosporum]|uniref:DUF6699 domain-containing protein n=1 Tax=Hebeloma cylindrosporum TaxID=76867 RepID=A0A0C2YJG4_HEBCY|nr:hypothetical protein M413DRAFT_15656 [Hebeloma cylindrosporum h7]